jgi:hypothetical protein
VTWSDVVTLVTGVTVAILSSSAFVLALFLGFCIILGFPKLRVTAGRKFMTIKSLDEMVGQERYSKYLPADSPRGPVDQLRTPELLEHKK